MKHPGVVVDESTEWRLGPEFELQLVDAVENYVSDVVSEIVHSLKLRLHWNETDQREPIGLQFCVWDAGEDDILGDTNVLFSVDHVLELAEEFYRGEPEIPAKIAAELRVMADRLEAIGDGS